MHMPVRFTLYLLTLFVSLLSACVVAPPQPQPAPNPYPAAGYTKQAPAPNYAYEDSRRCRADNQRAHADVVDSYERARRAGRIDPREAQQFNAMEARLANLRAQLARDGLTVQDCQRIGGAIARERDEVTRMSRYDPAVARCAADNRRAHEDIYAIYHSAQRAGRIDANEAQRFKAVEQRLGNFQAALKRDGLTLAECQSIGNTLAKERALVEQMGRRP